MWRWAALATAVLIQAAAGTNFNFPAYSTSLKAALGASQVGLNGLALASDLGKALGWSAGLAALCLPLSAVVAAAAGMGLVGYGLQWLLVARRLPIQYASVSPLREPRSWTAMAVGAGPPSSSSPVPLRRAEGS